MGGVTEQMTDDKYGTDIGAFLKSDTHYAWQEKDKKGS
jgi:hypothetical protein